MGQRGQIPGAVLRRNLSSLLGHCQSPEHIGKFISEIAYAARAIGQLGHGCTPRASSATPTAPMVATIATMTQLPTFAVMLFMVSSQQKALP